MGGQFDLTLTDIPYGEVNRSSNGLRNLDKEDADILTFNLQDFLKEIYEVTKSTIIIFCGKEQMTEERKRNSPVACMEENESFTYEWAEYLSFWH